MKKKVKKIPKYNGGTVGVYDPNMFNSNLLQAPSILNSTEAQNFNQVANKVNATIALENPTLYNQGVFQQAVSSGLQNPIEKTKSNVRGMLGSAAGGAGVGFMLGGPMGAGIGAAAGFLADALPTIIGTSGSVNKNTGDITNPSGIAGLFGRSKRSLQAESNRIKNTITNKQLTQHVNEQFMSNPNNNVNTNVYANAAEGGIMRQPVDVLVSKGELIYNPISRKLIQVPGSKGKPNKADDVYTRLSEGDVVISNSPTMLMANGKTPAQNLAGLVDKYSTGGTVKAREAIIKKVVNWQEARKAEKNTPQQYAKGTKYVNAAYNIASTIAPLLDTEKAESVNYTVPMVDYISTAVDTSSQYRDIDDSNAISNYNISKIYPNTGAGIAATVQSANNRAKQKASVNQYKTNAQNELIGKNVSIYNDWSTNHANLLNTVYDKSAANRATARNINRQNRATALKTWGQIMRDDKQYGMDRIKIEMLKPLLDYGTINSDTILQQLINSIG